jgi:hypothetical protein
MATSADSTSPNQRRLLRARAVVTHESIDLADARTITVQVGGFCGADDDPIMGTLATSHKPTLEAFQRGDAFDLLLFRREGKSPKDVPRTHFELAMELVDVPVVASQEEYALLKDAQAAVTEALRFGAHRPDCKSLPYGERPCSCGWIAAVNLITGTLTAMGKVLA